MAKGPAFPVHLLQEFRNLVSVVCRDIVMTDKASGEKTEEQQAMMEKLFHGDIARSSILTSFLDGKGDAEHMYDAVAIENNREGNSDRRNGSMLRFLDIFSCDIGETK
jgi:hypothetical protein